MNQSSYHDRDFLVIVKNELRQLELLLVHCQMSQHDASVPQGQICSDNYMCCHTGKEVAGHPFTVY